MTDAEQHAAAIKGAAEMMQKEADEKWFRRLRRWVPMILDGDHAMVTYEMRALMGRDGAGPEEGEA